jgi:putative SOS response-associated peptidase YedK
VGQKIPVKVFDEELGERVTVWMQWGFPKPKGFGFAHIHCRSETIDELPTFKPLFLGGQRGLVPVNTFNEGPDDGKGRTIQHTIDLHDDAPLAFAVLWNKFETPTGDLWACVQATVPANALILTLGEEVNRMPAFLDYVDWPVWLGEVKAHPLEVKALLQTREGVSWTMSKEEKAAQAKKDKRKLTVLGPTPGLF